MAPILPGSVRPRLLTAAGALALGATLALQAPGRATEREIVNSLGMRLVRIEAGTFLRGVGDRLLPAQLREPVDQQEARSGTPHRQHDAFNLKWLENAPPARKKRSSP